MDFFRKLNFRYGTGKIKTNYNQYAKKIHLGK